MKLLDGDSGLGGKPDIGGSESLHISERGGAPRLHDGGVASELVHLSGFAVSFADCGKGAEASGEGQASPFRSIVAEHVFNQASRGDESVCVIAGQRGSGDVFGAERGDEGALLGLAERIVV